MARKPARVATTALPHVEVIDESGKNLPAVIQSSTSTLVNVGKIPGEIHEVSWKQGLRIKDLFSQISVSLEHCEIQCNGEDAGLDDLIQPGDTILAIAKIKGNK